jgi:hypothetical protein
MKYNSIIIKQGKKNKEIFCTVSLPYSWIYNMWFWPWQQKKKKKEKDKFEK